MDALIITEHETAPGFQVPVVAPPLAVRDQVWERAGRPLPVRAIAPAQPSWERILVAAGLDRESRELSPAERWMADRSAGAP